RSTLQAGFSDAQCGFKAIRGDVAQRLLPLVEDTGWFFDTELLVLAERGGLRIHEGPVDWVDDPNSTVDRADTGTADLKGVWRAAPSLFWTRGRRSLHSPPPPWPRPACGAPCSGPGSNAAAPAPPAPPRPRSRPGSPPNHRARPHREAPVTTTLHTDPGAARPP